jgi:beta-lactamase class D
MKNSLARFVTLLTLGFSLSCVSAAKDTIAATNAAVFPVSQSILKQSFGNRHGCFIMIRCADGQSVEFNSAACDEKHPPCSTFKIWNTLIGLENGLIEQPDALFYKWDGQKRFIPDWNKDLTLREAFRVSCVPAFQDLARRIGSERMQNWLDKINYGDRDISAGIDVFWLSSSTRKTILITPREQVMLLRKLLMGELPFSAKSRAVLEDIMLVKKLEHGNLYGKTGSGVDKSGQYELGWFVGYLRVNGDAYVFASVLRGPKLSGKEARETVESIVTNAGWR